MANKTRADIRLLAREKIRQLTEDGTLQDNPLPSSGNTVTIASADTAHIQIGFEVQLEDEIMLVRDIDSTLNTLTVLRGFRGTTAASHVQNTSISIYPMFSDRQVNGWIDRGIRNLWPEFYIKKFEDVFQFLTNKFEYDLPDDLGMFLEIYSRQSNTTPLKRIRDYILLGNQIMFPRESVVFGFTGKNARVHYAAKPRAFDKYIRQGTDGIVTALGDDTVKFSSRSSFFSTSDINNHISIDSGDNRGSYLISAFFTNQTVCLGKTSVNSVSMKNTGNNKYTVTTAGSSRTDGVINLNLGFSSSAETFTSADIGSHIVIQSGNSNNQKSWKIIGFVDGNTVVLSAESTPVAETGLTFQIFRESENTIDSIQVEDDLWIEGILYWVAAEAIEEIKTTRASFTEYSAILNDRASSADELTREVFYWKNQFRIFKDNNGRDMPSYQMPWPKR